MLLNSYGDKTQNLEYHETYQGEYKTGAQESSGTTEVFQSYMRRSLAMVWPLTVYGVHGSGLQVYYCTLLNFLHAIGL